MGRRRPPKFCVFWEQACPPAESCAVALLAVVAAVQTQKCDGFLQAGPWPIRPGWRVLRAGIAARRAVGRYAVAVVLIGYPGEVRRCNLRRV